MLHLYVSKTENPAVPRTFDAPWKLDDPTKANFVPSTIPEPGFFREAPIFNFRSRYLFIPPRASYKSLHRRRLYQQ